MRNYFLLFVFSMLSVTAAFATFGGPAVIVDGNTGTSAGVTDSGELRVIQTSPIPVILPSVVPVHEVSPVPTQTVSGAVSVSNFPSTQDVNVINSPTVSISPLPTTSPVPVSVQGTASVTGAVSVSNFPAIQPVHEVSPVPTQTVSGSVSVSNFPSTQDVNVINSPTVSISPLPTTSPVPVSVQGTPSVKVLSFPNSSLSARQTVTTSESNLAAPSNAAWVLIECESTNADNLKWGFSNSSSNILASAWILCEPGRSEVLPVATGNFLHMISAGGGSDFMDVQWLLSQ